MTNAQIKAFMEISKVGEFTKSRFLNISFRTLNGMFKKGWVAEDCAKMYITCAGHAALDSAGY